MAALRSLRRPAFLCVLLLACLSAGVSAQPAFRVVDLNTAPTPTGDQVYFGQELKALGSVLFAVADDGIHGIELWRSDGTAAGTRLIKDICPGACGSIPHALTSSNGLLFFIADDGAHGAELWRTDGTEAGTLLVTDLNPGIRGEVYSLMDAAGTLFFIGRGSSAGLELWKTDGTTDGTHLVIPNAFGAARLLAASGGRVLFGAADSQGMEPWVSDGTEAGTVMVSNLNPGSASSIGFFDPYPVSILGHDAAAVPSGGFVFSADDGVHGMGLWFTDGTSDGTTRLKTLDNPHGMTAFNGAIYFAATDPASGTELWKTNGTAAGTVLVKDVRAGVDSSDPVEITVAGNRLFFRATDATLGGELVVSDGTAAGTVLMDLNPGPNWTFYPYGPNPLFYYGLSAFGNDLMFLGLTPGGGPLSVWRSNGTLAGTVPLAHDGFLYYQSPATAAVAGGRFYFRSDPGPEIWTSDGTPAGTHLVESLFTANSAFRMFSGKISSPHALGALGNLLFFQATDGNSGYQPWTSDGTPGGTSLVASLGPFVEGSYPSAFTPLGGREIFLTDFPQVIWASDGTPGGTQSLSDANTVVQSFQNLVTAGGSAFFRAYGFSFYQLWKTDGTPAGTLKLVEFPTPSYAIAAAAGKVFISTLDDLWVSDGITPGVSRLTVPLTGASFFEPNGMTEVGGLLFFFNIETNGWALWKSDGTQAGTSRVTDIVGSLGDLFTAPAGGPLFFLVDNGVTGLELWKSDGTGAGTAIVKDIFPGFRGSEITGLTVAGNRVYFVADDGVHGRELWASDGTDAGTHIVKDLLPGSGSSVPDSLAAVGNVLLFSATDGIHGVEPWRTDGTAVGTRMIQDIAPAELSSSPTGFTPAGPNVYFAANDNTTGFELWAAPKTNVLAIFGDVPTSYFAWRFVESLVVNGVTSGCGPGQFCPGSLVTRAEAAVFLLAARGTPPPPATGTVFTDVPPGFWAGPWIEQLAAEGIVGGCSTNPPRFCPGNSLTRAEMAILLLGARHVTPPPATGTVFSDVPANYWAARWIEQLAAEGISNGCGGGRFCPDQPITRAEMAVFLVANFHLPLP